MLRTQSPYARLKKIPDTSNKCTSLCHCWKATLLQTGLPLFLLMWASLVQCRHWTGEMEKRALYHKPKTIANVAPCTVLKWLESCPEEPTQRPPLSLPKPASHVLSRSSGANSRVPSKKCTWHPVARSCTTYPFLNSQTLRIRNGIAINTTGHDRQATIQTGQD